MKQSLLPILVCIVFLASGPGCSSNPQPISVVGERDDINLLVGTWRGHYEADDNSRSGVIEFQLARDSDTASGSVIMYAGDDRAPTASPEGASMSHRLAIRFIQLGKGFVSGRLDPYEDPDCRCVIETLFEGRLTGDVIEGGYSSRGVYEPFTRTGKWKVTRVSPEAPSGGAETP